MIFTPPLINPFTAEPPMQIHVPSTPCDILIFNSHARTTLSANLCRVKRSFKPYQNEHDSVQESGEKDKKPCNIDLKISMKIWFHHYPPTFFSSNPKILCFPKNFSHQNEAYLMLSKRKKLRQEKQKERRGEKKKSKSQHCCTFVTFKSKNYLDILLSGHAVAFINLLSQL